MAAGAAWGLTVLYAMWSIRPLAWPGDQWITGSTWDHASAVFWADPNWLLAALALMLVAGLVRARFAVAAALLLGPVAIVGMIRSGYLVHAFPGPLLVLASAMMLLAAILGTAAPWLWGGRTRHTGGRA